MRKPCKYHAYKVIKSIRRLLTGCVAGILLVVALSVAPVAADEAPVHSAAEQTGSFIPLLPAQTGTQDDPDAATADGYAAAISKTRIAAGLYHSAMIHLDGKLYTWGDNAYGQLGLPDTDYSDTPVEIKVPGQVKEISLGAYHTLVLTEQGHVYAFGRNTFGQLGSQSIENAWQPFRIEGLSDIVAVSAGAFHSLALDAQGQVWAWGNNSDWQVGDVPDQAIEDLSGTVTGRRVLSPQPLRLSDIKAISAGGHHSLALSSEGQVFAWGANDRGQLGNGTTQNHGTPSLVTGLEQVSMITAGYQHNVALTATVAQQPDQTDETTSEKTGETSSEIASAIASGTPSPQNARDELQAKTESDSTADNKTIAGDASDSAEDNLKQVAFDSVWTWGDDSFGQLGLGSDLLQSSYRALPVSLNWPAALPDTDKNETSHVYIDKIAAGTAHTALVIKTNGHHAFLLWGSNTHGQLGQRTEGNALNLPTLYTASLHDQQSYTFSPVQDIALGGYHTLVFSSLGMAGATGRGDRGQLGTLSVIDRYAFSAIDMTDIIPPFFHENSRLQAEWTNDGDLSLRWPHAYDNLDPRPVYRLYVRQPDQSRPVLAADAVSEQAYTLRSLKTDEVYEFILAVYDQGTADKTWRDLSRLVLYYLPEEYSDAAIDTLFDNPVTSIANTAGFSHENALGDPYEPVFLAVPWDLEIVFGSYYEVIETDLTALWLSIGMTLPLLVLIFLELLQIDKKRKKQHHT